MSADLATYISIIALALSALAWVIAAVTAPIIMETYWNGLPAGIVKRQKIASVFNAGAALLAAVGVALQAYASAMSG